MRREEGEWKGCTDWRGWRGRRRIGVPKTDLSKRSQAPREATAGGN